MTRRAVAVVVVVLVALAGAGCGGSAPPPSAPLRVTVATGGLQPTVATALAAGEGRAYTVAHALTGARSVRVGGRPARVLRVDRRLDLAALAVPGLHAARPRIASAGDAVTITVLRAGRAHPIRARVRRRATVAVTVQGTRVGGRPALELDVPVLPGDSGAPVTDAEGRVVGIVFARVIGRSAAWAVDLAGRASVIVVP